MYKGCPDIAYCVNLTYLLILAHSSLAGLTNFAGAESNADVAAGVLSFDSDGFGHEMAEACLENLRKEFRGDDWGNNGPGVITRVLKKLCKARQVGSTVQHSLIQICNGQCPEGRSSASTWSLRVSKLHVCPCPSFCPFPWFLLSPRQLPVKVCQKVLRVEFVQRNQSCR